MRLAFFLTLIILLAEIVGGLLANSLALLSDAGHVVTNIFALGLAWFATVQAERPPNARKTFGYHRVGILAAMVNAVTLIVIAFAILLEVVQRFYGLDIRRSSSVYWYCCSHCYKCLAYIT